MKTSIWIEAAINGPWGKERQPGIPITIPDIVADGIAAGGTEGQPAADYGFMYQRQLSDPDGNMLEFGWMDPVAAAQGPAAFMEQQQA